MPRLARSKELGTLIGLAAQLHKHRATLPRAQCLRGGAPSWFVSRARAERGVQLGPNRVAELAHGPCQSRRARVLAPSFSAIVADYGAGRRAAVVCDGRCDRLSTLLRVVLSLSKGRSAVPARLIRH